jgi:beta-carotene ketolase (CrtW type)
MGIVISLIIILVWAASLTFALLRPAISLSSLQFFDIILFLWLQFLFVGLFITSHDACHGTIDPKHPRVNLWIGRISAFLYAGLFFDKIKNKHMDHHQHPGTELDPDFLKSRDQSAPYLQWLLSFFKRYVTLAQLLIMTGAAQVLMHVFHLPQSNVFFFWVAPSLASAIQLFTFGTYLPHRHGRKKFIDRHLARNSPQSFWMSLLLCYHFGACHLRHHREPWVPWYALYLYR